MPYGEQIEIQLTQFTWICDPFETITTDILVSIQESW